MAVTLAQARAAKKSGKGELAALPGVTGVGISKVGADYVLKVNLREPLPVGIVAPTRIAAVAVHCEVIGTVTKRRRGEKDKG
jgi:hypothetical protein